MGLTRAAAVWAALAVCLGLPLAAQRNLAGTAAMEQALDRLRVTGSVLMIAAHPDDENTALLAYFARGRNLRTGYLSLTRGEGGQNLIGSEQGDLMGVIRTQELLAARHIDGAEQFFTRAIDFGFSKTAAETLEKWGHDEVLADVVWTIRRFQPDVIVLRFSGTARDGHGHHQASAMLGKEAFRAAADPARFPEQLKWVKPWQARRLYWNVFSFSRQQEQEAAALQNKVTIDTGEYNPVLGYSYGEIAGMSRSQHRSQGMGAPERKGAAPNYLALVDGEAATRDFMEGIDAGWGRVAGGAAVDTELKAAQAAFVPESPEGVIPRLVKARALMAAIDDPIARRKLEELDETIALASGLWLDVSAVSALTTPGGKVGLHLTAVNRSKTPVTLLDVASDGVHFLDGGPVALEFNQPYTKDAEWRVPDGQPMTQPLWLRFPHEGNLYVIPAQEEIGLAQGDAALVTRWRVNVAGAEIALKRPVENRFVDRVRGEQVRPLVVAPPSVVKISQNALLFPSAQKRTVEVEARANRADVAGKVLLEAPNGWTVSPAAREFKLATAGQTETVTFEVTPPAGDSSGFLQAAAIVEGLQNPESVTLIDYEHIPLQTVFQPAKTRIVREDVKTTAKQVGYVMGAGDDVPAALGELGCMVTMLTDSDLSHGDLSKFDAVVTGVRAFNTRPALKTNLDRLLQFAEAGGTVVVQYNVMENPIFRGDDGSLNRTGPYPLKVGRDRVTVEDSPVKILKPDHRLMTIPNRITQSDFEGWLQERGLYFASEWDPKYETMLEMNDPGEKPLAGGLLYARTGKGAYVFCPLSFFRELPAGVPGAYRLFANFVSAGKQ
jgi:LmbE family N-acetylglucosaminyl deacetylase